jgi:DNA-binding transcriptional MocR family regulator
MVQKKWNKEEQEREMKLRHEYRRRRKEALEALEKELEKDEENTDDRHGSNDV